MKAFLLLGAVAIFVILPNSVRAEADACKPFFDIEEVKKEDKDARDAIKKVKQAEQQVDEFQGFCAKQKADNTLSNQDQLISQDQNQRDAVMIKNNIAKDALKKGQESAVSALKKMNEPEVKKRPGRSDCAKSLIADNDTLNNAKAELNGKGAALSSCAPPAKKDGAASGNNDSASSGKSWPRADSAKQDGFTADPNKSNTDISCRTSVFGCVQNSDGTYSTKIREGSSNQFQAPSVSIPRDSNGQVKLHNCPDGGNTCRSLSQ